MKRRIIGLAVSAGVLAGLALLWFLVLSPRVRGEIFRSRMRVKLESPDPAARRDAARSIAEKPDPFLVTRIAQAIYGDEQDPTVVAAYVAALGEIGDRGQLPAVRFAAEPYQPGEVRAAAWVALARLAPDEFETRVAEAGSNDEWQTLGLARARIVLDDWSGAAGLLRLAESRDVRIAALASQTLDGQLRPLLAEIGQWPLDAAPREPWPAEFAGAIGRRIAGVDLAELAIDSARAAKASAGIRPTLKRILNGRNRIENWLTDPNNHRWIP